MQSRQSRIDVGDIVLAHKHTTIGHLIAWKLNGIYGHVAPIVNQHGSTLEMHPFRKHHFGSIKRYFDGRHRIVILRPKQALSHDQKEIATDTLHHMQKVMKYDLMSLLGFVVNDTLDNKKKVNCAEGSLRMYHDVGMLRERSYDRISPQTFYEFWKAGLFEVIYKNDNPRDAQWKALGLA